MISRQDVLEKLKSYEEEALDFWRKIVEMGGCCDDTESMLKLAGYLKKEFEQIGVACQLIDVGGNHPPVLTGQTEFGCNELPILFSGHYDTVFPLESYEHPAFEIKNGIARGPGVLDMKGGIAIAWLVIKILNEIKFNGSGIRIFFAGDEEVDRGKTRTIEYIEEICKDCRFAFNMETGNKDRSICIGRKGVEEFVVTVKGVSSHPGNFFERGRNAIEEAARKLILMQELTAPDFSYTVNVGTIHAGTVSNVIPDECVFKIDTRFIREKDRAYLEQQIRRICQMQFIPDTVTEVYSTGVLPPFETHEKEEALYNYVKKIAEQYNLIIPEKKILGGASDAAYISRTNTPVLCSMGVCGENNHSEDEYAETASLCERAELLLYTIMNYENFIV